MRRFELELVHNYKNRFVGRHRLKGRSSVTLGSSRDADIHLLGEDVSGVHAILEKNDQGWKISDMGSDKGTWIEKRPIVEQTISSPTLVSIGGHTINIIPREINLTLFSSEQTNSEIAPGSKIFHQVIVKKDGFVQETLLLDLDTPYRMMLADKEVSFKCPENHKWTSQSFGNIVIQQRRVGTRIDIDFDKDNSEEPFFDSNLKFSLMVAAVLGFIISIFLILEMRKPSDSMAVKPDANNFTRMIFDAKTLKSKREQATKATKTIVGESKSMGSEGLKPTSSQQGKRPEISQVAAKVVTKIRAAGLSQLIGKISKRAATTASYIESAGRAPDSVPSGPALGVAGTAAIKPGAKVGTQAYRVDGVATSGKGGGSAEYKGSGGLSIGNVGNATVGVIEEETEVDGGLDKDVIAGVIKTQIGQIRYCYERQLSASPDLYGKVLIKFTIGETGSVVSQSIGSTTLGNAMVEGCILRRVSGWRFPKPTGGTAVVVTYPFLFKATN